MAPLVVELLVEEPIEEDPLVVDPIVVDPLVVEPPLVEEPIEVLEPFSVTYICRVYIPRGDLSHHAEVPLTTFDFVRNEWVLYGTQDDTCIRIYLCRRRCLPSFAFPIEPICISVKVLDNVEQVIPELSETEYLILDRNSFNLGNARIWRRNTEDVKREVPNFAEDRLLMIRITLTGIYKENGMKYCPTREVAVQTSLNINPIPCFESLSEDLSKVQKGKNWDPDVVELICEGQTIIGHKMILCSRSPVLAAMIKSDMVKNRARVVEIQDMDIDTFQRFLRYLYHGNLDDTVTFDSYMRLYKAGDMYQVEALKRRCSRYLIENLTVDNANDVLSLAEAHDDSFFVDAVASFLLEKKDFPLGHQYDDFLARWLALHLQFSNL